jgi:hypothetical protein
MNCEMQANLNIITKFAFTTMDHPTTKNAVPKSHLLALIEQEERAIEGKRREIALWESKLEKLAKEMQSSRKGS